jgi:hypothetical protein
MGDDVEISRIDEETKIHLLGDGRIVKTVGALHPVGG